MGDGETLNDVLKGVSRSFYLSIRVLPKGMRDPVAVAYLLARAADTIADTRALPPEERLEHLRAFRDRVEGTASPEAVDRIVQATREHTEKGTAAEAVLLERVGQIFDLLEALPLADKGHVRQVVATLTRGMEMDLATFPPEDSGELGHFDSPQQLDCYTYLVAGCVGAFWAAVAMAHEPRLSGWQEDEISALGVRFGKALQLTNVLRDVPRDLRMGRCYLPQADLYSENLSPFDLLEPRNSSWARAVLFPWMRVALGHFEAAESYLLAAPRRCVRLRLAALWPILLGLATLEKLARNDSWLDPDQPSRVKRRWVYWMMARSLVAAHSDTLLRYWIRSLRNKVEKALDGG